MIEKLKRKNEIIIGNEKINKEVTIKELHISILINTVNHY